MRYCFFENGWSFKGLWAENFENGITWIYSPPRMTRNLVIFCRGSPTTLPQPWQTKWINILFELFRKGTFPLTFPWTPLVFQCLCRQKMKGSIQRLILVTGMRGPQKITSSWRACNFSYLGQWRPEKSRKKTQPKKACESFQILKAARENRKFTSPRLPNTWSKGIWTPKILPKRPNLEVWYDSED